MAGGKDEGKTMDPLFPRLHLHDADIGGPRPPPRNKMALFDQYNVSSERTSFNSSSMGMLPLPSANDSSGFVPQTSSSNVGNTKQNLVPASSKLSGSSRSPEKYHFHCSKGVDLNAPATNFEPRGLGRPTNYQNPFVSENLMMAPESNLLSGRSTNCYLKKDGNENGFRLPSFLRPTKTPSVGNHQLASDKERHATSSFVPSGKLKLVDSCMKQPKDDIRDQTRNLSDKNFKDNEVYIESPVIVLSKGVKVPSSAVDHEALQSINHKKSSIFVDERSRSHDPHAELCDNVQESCTIANGMSERLKRKRNPSVVQDLSHSFPKLEENNEIHVEAIKRCSEDKDCGPMQLGNVDSKRQEISQTSVSDSIPGLDLTSDDVVGVIGQKLFWKTRKTILHQQRIFASQIFELHRLLTVQKLIAKSPEILHDNKINLNIPSIKFPPINNLLYEIPLNPSCLNKKPKIDNVRPNNSIDRKRAEAICGKLVPSVKNKCSDKEHRLPQQSSPKSSSTSPSILSEPELKPFCFHPPPGNQWLVPVRSPSEGLIYKPFTGPAPPSVSILAPVPYGNCGPINVSSPHRTAFCLSAPNPHGTGRSSGPTLGFQPIAMPILNVTSPNVEIEKLTQWGHPRGSDKHSSTKFDLNLSVPCQDSCHVRDPPDHCGRKPNPCRDGSETQGSCRSSPTRHSQRKAILSLFPTTPSSHHASKNQSDEQKVQAIKVVPHNRRSAPEFAARIFQFIQEERKRT